MSERPHYDKALAALNDLHAFAMKHHSDVLGMSHGAFSGVNVALGIVSLLEQENAALRKQLTSTQRPEGGR